MPLALPPEPLAPYGPLPPDGTVRPITRWGSAVMHRVQQPVTAYDESLRALVADMVATMYAADGVGLAACQIGVDLAVFVFDCPDESERHVQGVVCNPVLTLPEGAARKLVEADEGCLSLPGAFVECARPDYASVSGTGLAGEPVVVLGRRAAGALPPARDRPRLRHRLRRPDQRQDPQSAAEGARQGRG